MMSNSMLQSMSIAAIFLFCTTSICSHASAFGVAPAPVIGRAVGSAHGTTSASMRRSRSSSQPPSPIATLSNFNHNSNSDANSQERSTMQSTIFGRQSPTTTTTTLRMQHKSSIFTQVISDVDDTLKSSGGVNVAGVALGGIDVQYERGDFYPGVAEFMLEMSRFGVPDNTRTIPKVAILTARAEEFKVALEIKDSSSLAKAMRSAGETAGIDGWGVGPVLYGSVAEWIVQYRKGLRKFTNFERLLLQDPTGMIFQYVYVGDTGELDQEAGEAMLREYPEVVKAVFLHVVSDIRDPPPDIPAPKMINGRPLVFFKTYVGAAVDAVQLGFMSVDGLQSVMDAAVLKLQDVPKTSDKWDDITIDMARAEVILQES